MWLRSRVAWLWCRLVAAALIQPLAWELPYALGVALKKEKKKKKKHVWYILQVPWSPGQTALDAMIQIFC